MSRSRSTPPDGKAGSPPGPRAALDALLAGDAGNLLRRALWLDALDQLLRPHLPPGMAAHARLANVRGDRLVFVVDAPVWHARLRLAGPGLLDAARSFGLDVAGMTVRTSLQPLRPQLPAARPPPSIRGKPQPQLEAALALLRSQAQEDAASDRPARGRRARKPPTEPASGAS